MLHDILYILCVKYISILYFIFIAQLFRTQLSTIHTYIHQLILNTTFTTNSSLLNSIPDYHLTFSYLFLPFLTLSYPFASLGLDNYSHFMLYAITTSIITNIHIIIRINIVWLPKHLLYYIEYIIQSKKIKLL